MPDHYRSRALGGGRRSLKALRRIRYRRDVVPASAEPTRSPHPAEAWNEAPAAVAIRHPAPRVWGHPGVAHAGIEQPGTVSKRAPARAGEIRLPHRAVARNVVVVAVVVEIADAVAVGIILVGTLAGIFALILGELFIPGIEGILFDVLGDGVSVVGGEIKGRRPVLAQLDRPGGSVDFQVAIEDRHRRVGIREADSKM